MKARLIHFGTFCCASAMAFGAYSQGLVGNTVSVVRENGGPIEFGPIQFVVQAGPADTVALSTSNNRLLNVEDSSLLFSFGSTGYAGGNNGAQPMDEIILFQDLSPSAPTIVGLTYHTDLNGFGTNSLAFTAHTVIVGIGNIYYAGSLTVDLQFAQGLSITRLADAVVLSWPTNSSGYTLQSTANLSSPIWTTNLPAPVVVKGQYTVTNTISGPRQFFRLSQ